MPTYKIQSKWRPNGISEQITADDPAHAAETYLHWCYSNCKARKDTKQHLVTVIDESGISHKITVAATWDTPTLITIDIYSH